MARTYAHTPLCKYGPMQKAGGAGAGGGATLEFYAPLTSSLTLSTGTATPTFTRATTATVVTSDGLITLVASGEARFQGSTRNAENDWTAHANSDGVLIEEARTNGCTYSEDFTDASWISRSLAGVTADDTTAPDGTSTADLMIPNSSNADHVKRKAFTHSTTTDYTLSVYAKKSSYDYIIIRALAVANDSAWFNINTGTVGTVQAGVTASIADAGNGWYRCSVHFTTGASISNDLFDIGVTNADNTNSWAGDNLSGNWFWGAQMETGAFATSYIPTAAASVTRNADILRYDYQPPALSASMLAICTPLSSSYINNLYGINSGTACRYLQTSGGNSTVSARDGATNLTYGVTSASVAMSLGLTWEDGASPEQATYLDGSQSNTGALDADGYVSGANIGIGVRADGDELWLSGAYKEIKFYDAARSQAEMEADTA